MSNEQINLMRSGDGMPNPYLYSYITNNTPYKFTNFNSITTESSESYGGLGELNGNYRYVLYNRDAGERYPKLMSPDSLNWMSTQITKKLTGVHPDGKNIIVPQHTIKAVADSMFEANAMAVDVLQEMTINYIVSQIKTEFETIQQNNKLSIWVQKYDTSSGMQRFNGIKLNNKSKKGGQNWNY